MRTLISSVLILFCLGLWAQVHGNGSTIVDSLYAIPELDGSISANSAGLAFSINVTTYEIKVGDLGYPYDVEWGGDTGNPDYATESLTINNCFFNDLTNHVDTQGNAYQVFSISNSVVASDPLLDSSNHPIWTASTMSPCIDTGMGNDDPDNTPPDIGACSADSHNYWEYSFENQADHERWYWVSYPVLNTRTDGMLQASEYFQELLELGDDSYGNPAPIYLDEITWVVGEDAEIKNQWFGRTVTHSDRKFSYEEAQERIENQEGDLLEEIMTLDRLAKILRKQRIENGACF